MPDPLERSALGELLDLARRAPSAGYSQGVHLFVLDGAELAEMWQVSGAGEWFARTAPGVLAAPAVVVVLADERAYAQRYAEPGKSGHGLEDAQAWPVPYWLTDAAMVAQNLLLLAEDARLGALFFGIFRNHEALLRALGVPDGVHIVGAIAIGRRAPHDAVSGSPLRRPRRPASEVIHWNRW